MAEAAEALESSERVASKIQECKDFFASEEGKKELSGAKTTCSEEAQVLYKAGDYNGSLDKFCKYLAAVKLDKTPDPEVEASLYANLASCLHHLDELELAKKYYTLALELFEAKCATSRLTWLVYGDINQRRVDYVKARVGSLSIGQKPDKSKYLDGYGKEQQWSSYELGPEGQEFGYLDYVNPVSWYRYYTAPALEEAQPEAPAPA